MVEITCNTARISQRTGTMSELKGCIVAAVTPMSESTLDVDYKSITELTDFLIDGGVKGIVAVGTTGEAPGLNEEERCRVVSTFIEASRNRVPVIAGTGTNCTRDTIYRTKEAQRLGADGALIVCPYYNKPTQEGIYMHYKSVAESCPNMPIISYNVPGRTCCDMQPETVNRLSKISNIIGHKEASGKVERFAELAKICGDDDFKIFSGDDGLACEVMLKRLAVGVISVSANVIPRVVQQMCEAALSNNCEKAKAFNEAAAALNSDLFIESNPTPVKWLLSDMGRIPGGIRLPLLPLSSHYHDLLRTAYKKAQKTFP